MTLCSGMFVDGVISEEIFLKALWHFNAKSSWSKYESQYFRKQLEAACVDEEEEEHKVSW